MVCIGKTVLKSNGADFPLRDRIRPVNNILTFPSGFLYSTLLRMAGIKITGRNLHFKKVGPLRAHILFLCIKFSLQFLFIPKASICPSCFYINSKNETEYHAVSKMASIPSQTESMTSIGGKNVDTLPRRA